MSAPEEQLTYTIEIDPVTQTMKCALHEFSIEWLDGVDQPLRERWEADLGQRLEKLAGLPLEEAHEVVRTETAAWLQDVLAEWRALS